MVGGPDIQDSTGILFLHASWLSGCRCWLHVAFSGSFFFFLSGKVILAQMVTQKSGVAASSEVCCCVGTVSFPVNFMRESGSIFLAFFAVNKPFPVKW